MKNTLLLNLKKIILSNWKKALYIAVSLLLMFAIAATVAALYSDYDDMLKFDEIAIKDKQVDSSGKVFSASFKCEVKGKILSKYDYRIEKTTVYVTLYANADGKTDFELDSDGYTKIVIPSGSEIKKVVYVCGFDEDNISFTKK